MNEKLKELAEQAGEHASIGSNHKERAEWQELFEGKFAELIVKECADCSYHMGKDSGPITADLIKIRIMSLLEG